MKKSIKDQAIIEEVRTAYSLIQVGLGTLIQMKENAYTFHVPLFQISNGIERLLKCIILIDYYTSNNNYPNDKRFFKNHIPSIISGHELDGLFKSVISIYENTNLIKGFHDSESDYKYLTTNYIPKQLLVLLSAFATETRYRNLNVLLGANNKEYISPEDSMVELIKEIIKTDYKNLNENEYRLFDLAVREIFNAIVKMARFSSVFFVFGGYGFEGAKHIFKAWTFLKYAGDPILDLEKYKK